MCYFTTPDQDSRTRPRTSSIPSIPLSTPISASEQNHFEAVSSLDFGHYIDSTPLSVHPHLPLETVMEMFKKLGPRVILVELRGKVCGLVTVKDVLKYQFKVENEERPRVERDEGAEERVWSWIESAGKWVNGLWTRITRRGPPRTPRTPQPGEGVRLEEEVELVDQRSDQD